MYMKTYIHIQYIHIHIHIYMKIYIHIQLPEAPTCVYIFKTIGLFCRISSLLQGSFAKETYNLDSLCMYV